MRSIALTRLERTRARAFIRTAWYVDRMAKSASKRAHRNEWFKAKGVEASQLRRHKYALVRQFGLPEDLLGGALSLTHRRCGKAGCRCASGDLHPMWTLTYSVAGKRHVEVIPHALVPLLQPLVERGQVYRDAVAEVRRINAQLLHLWRQEQRSRDSKPSKTKRKTARRKRRRQPRLGG